MRKGGDGLGQVEKSVMSRVEQSRTEQNKQDRIQQEQGKRTI